MWATRFFKNALRTPSFASITNSSKHFISAAKPPINDCAFMQLKSQLLVPNFFLHNIRELLEKMSVGDQLSGLTDLMELSLINQSKLACRIIS